MNETALEKIEQYLNNEMSQEERVGFELQIANDEALRNYVQLYDTIDKTMSVENTSPNENELRQTLQQMNRKYFAEEGKVIQVSFKKWLAIAASVIIVVTAGVYFLSSNKTSPEKLYAEYAKHDPLNIQLRGNTTDSLAQNAAAAFNKRSYEAALPLLDQYLSLQPDDIQMKFSLAICDLETGKNKEADSIFSMIASGQTAYAATAQWYQALSVLKQKDITKCRTILNSIPQTSSFSAKAKELLKKLPD
jgi:tetratricopeptide (TPR) repeat protein